MGKNLFLATSVTMKFQYYSFFIILSGKKFWVGCMFFVDYFHDWRIWHRARWVLCFWGFLAFLVKDVLGLIYLHLVHFHLLIHRWNRIALAIQCGLPTHSFLHTLCKYFLYNTMCASVCDKNHSDQYCSVTTLDNIRASEKRFSNLPHHIYIF